MNTLTTNQLTWNKNTKTFSTEISDLPDDIMIGRYVYILNPKTGVNKRYVFTHRDTDGEGDILGWNYKNKETNTNLLIIND